MLVLSCRRKGRWAINTHLQRCWHEIYQNSNSGNCHKTRWNTKITDEKKAQRTLQIYEKEGTVGQTWDFENLFAQLTREYIKFLEIFEWLEAVTSSLTRNFSSSIDNKDPQIDSSILGFHTTSPKFRLRNYHFFCVSTFMWYQSTLKPLYKRIFGSKGFFFFCDTGRFNFQAFPWRGI